jgi:hypothetical protein
MYVMGHGFAVTGFDELPDEGSAATIIEAPGS